MRVTFLSLFLASIASGGFAACNVVNGEAHGDCSGVTVNTGRSAFQVVDTYRALTGVSEGAHVLSGGSLSVSGTATRVIVEQGGTAHVTGIVQRLEVSGSARVSGRASSIMLRDGGRVTIEGMVGQISGNGTALLEAGSVVAGRPTNAAREVGY